MELLCESLKLSEEEEEDSLLESEPELILTLRNFFVRLELELRLSLLLDESDPE